MPAAKPVVRRRVEVWRLSSNEVLGTLGELWLDGKFYCYTIEPPWRGNRRDNPGTSANEASCLIPGAFECFVRTDDHWPKVLDIVGEIERDGALVHSGNKWPDSKACVLVGQHDGGLDKFLQFGFIVRSRDTLRRLCSSIGPGRHDFIIHSIAESKLRNEGSGHA